MKNTIKLFAAIVFLLQANSASAYQLRLTETSITENGRVHSLPDSRLTTKGYGLTYIHQSGAGVSLTQLNTSGETEDSKIDMDHSYLDFSYTAGETWLATFGYGIGLSGNAVIDEENSKAFDATSFNLGVGYRYSKYEIYWINRLNFMKYDFDSRMRSATSTHYQLGLGILI